MGMQVIFQQPPFPDGKPEHGLHVRIVSPSGKVDAALIDSSRRRLESWGFRVSEGAHARGGYGRFAGTETERASDLLAAFSDESVDAVLCSRGGYGLQQIIDSVAAGLEPLLRTGRRLPLLVGFSDITCLHSLLGIHTVPTVHGLMCRIGELPARRKDVLAWRRVVNGGLPSYTLPPHPLNRAGTARGMLAGGNLSVLYGLQDTPWSLKNICLKNREQGFDTILFIEDVGERHYHIDRMMNNLRLSGVLGMVSGMVAGQFTECDKDPLMPCSVLETVRCAAEEYHIPLLFGFPAGHGSPNFPLLFHRPAVLTVEQGGGSLLYESRTTR